MLASAMESVFILENPGSSLIFHYRWVVEAMRRLRAAQVKAGSEKPYLIAAGLQAGNVDEALRSRNAQKNTALGKYKPGLSLPYPEALPERVHPSQDFYEVPE